MLDIAAMTEILNNAIPPDLEPAAKLPGVRPLGDASWLTVDDAYAAQVDYRRKLIATRRDAVFWQSDTATDAVAELHDAAVQLLPALGFSVTARHIFCPDGVELDREADNPLVTLGKAVQEDICILQKQGDEHVLTAAVLCFPAGWTLAEKGGRALSHIHAPVDVYDDTMARRVQRMFNAVRSDSPLWRNNYLHYDNADLFQPLTEAEAATRRTCTNPQTAPYIRAERQSILRLPKTQALVFSIHTYVAKAQTG